MVVRGRRRAFHRGGSRGGRRQAAANPAGPVGVVSNIKVLSDKVPNVSSLEAWKKAFIKEGMSDKEKALAIFNTEVTFQQADAPPKEYLQREDSVLDPDQAVQRLRLYALLGELGERDVPGPLRGPARPLLHHQQPRGAGDLLRQRLAHVRRRPDRVFPKADGSIASIQEIVDGVSQVEGRASRVRHGQQGKPLRLHGQARLEDRPGHPPPQPLLRRHGLAALAEFAWGDTMLQFGRIQNNWQSCYSMGYRVNVQLRQGERLTRNWFNKGLHVNMDRGETPGSLKAKVGEGSFRHSPTVGRPAPGRVGNGTLEYDVPLASGAFRGGALTAANLAARSEDQRRPGRPRQGSAASPASSISAWPSSYVYLSGQFAFTPVSATAARSRCSSPTTTPWTGSKWPTSTRRASRRSTSSRWCFAAICMWSAS